MRRWTIGIGAAFVLFFIALYRLGPNAKSLDQFGKLSLRACFRGLSL